MFLSLLFFSPFLQKLSEQSIECFLLFFRNLVKEAIVFRFLPARNLFRRPFSFRCQADVLRATIAPALLSLDERTQFQFTENLAHGCSL